VAFYEVLWLSGHLLTIMLRERVDHILMRRVVDCPRKITRWKYEATLSLDTLFEIVHRRHRG
jgi:hypothetical protein